MMGYAPQQQQQWSQQQAGGGGGGAGWGNQAYGGAQQSAGANAGWNSGGQQTQQQGWQQQQAQQQGWGQSAAPAAAAAAADNTIGQANNIVVTGCTHATVGVIARGSYTLNAENHGRRAYKRDSQVNGLDVMIYFWDERDGPNFCGWWFGPKIGGDQVWAYHPDKSATTPPKSGWKVPYDGPVDPTFLITPSKPGMQAGGQMSAAVTQAVQQQQAPAMQQQAQWQQQQQQPQQGQWQAQQAAQQALQQQKLQQQKLIEEQRKKQQDDIRAKQMEQQKIRLEENRKKLEEANKKRIEEQQQKMAELKAKQEMLAAKAQEERKKKEEELQKKREEARATLAVRKVIQKLRITQGKDNVEAAKQELAEVIAQEEEALFSMKEKIKEEADSVIKAADERLQKIEEAKKKAEEMKAAEERKKQEAREKAEQLLAELAGMVTAAEEANKAFTAETMPLTSETDLTVEQVQAAGESCVAAGEEVRAKAKACSEFVQKNNQQMKVAPEPFRAKPKAEEAKAEEAKAEGEGEENKEAEKKPDMKDLLGRMSEIQRSSEMLIRNVGTLKMKAEKKAMAKKKLGTIQKTFKKYDKDGDNMLSKKELVAYAKGEFTFSVPASEADNICRMLVEEGQNGVPLESFSRLKAYVGILREKAKDDKRKEKRLAHEKEIADKKEKVKKTAEEVSEVVTEATEKIKEMETACAPLPSKSKAMKSKEMSPLADETTTVVEAAKSLIAKARKMIADLSEGIEVELKAFVATESAKLTGRMSKFDGQVKKNEDIITKFRAEVSKKDKEEVEAFRIAAIKKLRAYQKDNQVKTEAVFKKINTKGSGKVTESELVKFLLKTCKPTNGDAEEKEEEEVELSEDDISRLFAYLDEEEEGSVSEECMMSLIRCYMKVTKETVITTEKNIQEAKPIRRLEVGEVCFVVEGPVKEDTVDVMRYLVKSMKDDTEGWVTPVGNQGTKFLEETVGGLIMKVVKETILTASFEICSDAGKEQFRKLKDTTRKLKPGEQVEVLQWMKKDETSGLMRAKVKTKAGNHTGWATAVGNNGVPFLELA